MNLLFPSTLQSLNYYLFEKALDLAEGEWKINILPILFSDEGCEYLDILKDAVFAFASFNFRFALSCCYFSGLIWVAPLFYYNKYYRFL